MTLREWWKSKGYWMRGGILGLALAIVLTIVLVLNLNPKCVETPSCTEYGVLFITILAFFGPIGIVVGMIVGFGVDRIKK